MVLKTLRFGLYVWVHQLAKGVKHCDISWLDMKLQKNVSGSKKWKTSYSLLLNMSGWEKSADAKRIGKHMMQ